MKLRRLFLITSIGLILKLFPAGQDYSHSRKSMPLYAKNSSEITLNVDQAAMVAKEEDKTAKKSNDPVKSVNIFQKPGGRAAWLQNSDLIAFDKRGSDGYFDVYTVHPDGSGLVCLTCDKEGIPAKNNGNPAWHPSGKFIAIQVQDPYLEAFKFDHENRPEGGRGRGGDRPPGGMGPSGGMHHGGMRHGGGDWKPKEESGNKEKPSPEMQERMERYLTGPSMGINNNIWIITSDGSKFWQITHVEERQGVLNPRFSPDGTKLIWSEIADREKRMAANWSIKIADFEIQDDKPIVSNIRSIRPDNLQIYQTHGFSPDSKNIILSAVEKDKFYYDMELYTMELKPGKVDLVRLTNNKEWDGYARYTPDGKSIIWASSEGVSQDKANKTQDLLASSPRLEYWIMNADGSNKRQLTHFNDPTNAFFNQDIISVGDFAWAHDGKTIAATVRIKGSSSEATAIISFNDFQ